MKLSTTKSFSLESFPSDVRGWMGRLLVPLNSFLSQVYQALTGNLTTAHNLKCRAYDLKIGKGVTYPFRVRQAYTLNERPVSVVIGLIREDVPQVAAPPPVAFTWVYESDRLDLYFDGLDPNKQYSVTVIAQV